MEFDEVLLSICITSYNRVNELKRCLESIDANISYNIEIIVSEDCSPMKEDIRLVVERYRRESGRIIIFNSNPRNLGYDRNLGKLISMSTGQFIMLMSDDDVFNKNELDICIQRLMELDSKTHMAYTYFTYINSVKMGRKRLKDKFIKGGIENCRKYLYDSILFSGLIFRRESVECISADRFVNLNYFQVYLFLCCMIKHDTIYIDRPLICCMGDGESAYGLVESSKDDENSGKLANRSSIISNVYFVRGLIEVIKIFDEENGTKLLLSFEKEYSVRSYTGLSIARQSSLESLNDYWKAMQNLTIHIRWHAKLYYLFLRVFGYNVTDRILSGARKCALWMRKI